MDVFSLLCTLKAFQQLEKKRQTLKRTKPTWIFYIILFVVSWVMICVCTAPLKE